MLPLLLAGSANAAIPGDTDPTPTEPTTTAPAPPAAPPPLEQPPEPVTVILPSLPEETAPPSAPPGPPVDPPLAPASPTSRPAPLAGPIEAPKPPPPPPRPDAPLEQAGEPEKADEVVRAPTPDPALRAAVEEAEAVSTTVTNFALALRARAARSWATSEKTTPARIASEAQSAGSFTPPLPRAEPVASAVQADSVPAAPLLAMLMGMLILLVALTPEALVARVGLRTSDRMRGVAMGVGLAGLVAGLLLLLASA